MALQGPVDQTALEKRRLKAVRLFDKGIAPSEVARRLGVHRQSAGRWRKEWEQGGNKALASKGRIGRKRALSEEQEQQLAGILKAGAVAAGMPTEVWTLPRVAKVIRNEFGVGYHPAHVSKVLAAMGFSCQRPTRRAIERDEDKIRHWKRYQWPVIKKKPAAKGV
jgi:transposase